MDQSLLNKPEDGNNTNLPASPTVADLNLPASFAQNMTPEVIQRVNALKTTIDPHDKQKVIAFGREEQGRLGNFYDQVIGGTSTQAVGEAGALLTQVVGQLRGYGEDANSTSRGLVKFFKKKKAEVLNLQTKYKSLSANMSTVVKELQNKDQILEQVSRNFDVMYDQNQQTFEYLTIAIYAGEEVLKEENEKLKKMQAEAQASGDMMQIQKVSDFKDELLAFERRIYDLKLSRTMAINQAPQIRNIQKSADEVSESIKSAIVTAIPLWKSQMAIALGMEAVEQGLNAVNAVRDVTNQMLIANSEKNKELSLKAAEAIERGVIDIETLNIVNNNLIETLDGTSRIASAAVTKRIEGAKQLQEQESRLKTAMNEYAKSAIEVDYIEVDEN